jgi:hypothetical protein
MELTYEEGKLNFIIELFLPLEKMMSGGLMVLHKLAYKLAERGHNVYIFCDPEYPHPNIKTIKSEVRFDPSGFIQQYEWEGFNFPLKNTISIYPQITYHNPFNTEHVARWILYDTQKEIEDTYGENDVYFDYSNFKTFRLVPSRRLTVVDYKLNFLKITNTGKRKSFCHIIHKNTPPGGEKIFDQLNSFDLTDWKSKGVSGGYNPYDYLRDMFNQYEYFLTYDQKTYLSVMATLCGCKTVILNPGKPYEFTPNAKSEIEEISEITPTEFRINNYLQQYGIAYGWDDLQWANNTLPLVRDYISSLEKFDDKSVDSFINYWKNKIF